MTMKLRIGGLVVIAALIVAAVVVLARSPAVPVGRAVTTPPVTGTPHPIPTRPASTPVPTATPSPTPRLPTPTIWPTVSMGNPTPLPTSTGWPTATAAPPTTTPTPLAGTPGPAVDFELAFQLEGSGFTRKVNARVTNTGIIEAHNVTASVQLWSGNSRIKVNGKDILVEELGNLAPGATVTRSITISVGFVDGLKLQTSGGVVIVDVVHNEGSKQFRFII